MNQIDKDQAEQAFRDQIRRLWARETAKFARCLSLRPLGDGCGQLEWYSDGVPLPPLPVEFEPTAEGGVRLRLDAAGKKQLALAKPTSAIIMPNGASLRDRDNVGEVATVDRRPETKHAHEHLGQLVADSQTPGDTQGRIASGPFQGKYTRPADSCVTTLDLLVKGNKAEEVPLPLTLPIKLVVKAADQERHFIRYLSQVDDSWIPTDIRDSQSGWYGGRTQLESPSAHGPLTIDAELLTGDDLALAAPDLRRAVAEQYGHKEASIEVDPETGDYLIATAWQEGDAVALLFENDENESDPPQSSPCGDAFDWKPELAGVRAKLGVGNDTELFDMLLREAKPRFDPKTMMDLGYDAFQEASLKLWKTPSYLDGCETKERVIRYFRMMWQDSIYDLLRKRKRRCEEAKEAEEVADASQLNPADEVIRREWAEETLPQLLSLLSDKQRTAIEHFYFDGLKWKEVAVALGKKNRATSLLGERALKKLQKAVGSET